MKEFNVNGSIVSLALLADVSNSRELLDSIQAGTLEPEVALLNALLIPDVFPVLAAAYNALIDKSRATLKTRTPHSELIYNYSGSKHITESLRRCGISDKITYILAVCFGDSSKMKGLEKTIKGKLIDLEELEARADRVQILKVRSGVHGRWFMTTTFTTATTTPNEAQHYKITSQELGVSSLSDSITCRIAVRDAL